MPRSWSVPVPPCINFAELESVIVRAVTTLGGNVFSAKVVSHQESSIDEEDVGLDALETVRKGVLQRSRMLVVVVGMGSRERRGGIFCVGGGKAEGKAQE